MLKSTTAVAAAGALLLWTGAAFAADAGGTLEKSRVYAELHRIAVQQWERIYSHSLADPEALAGARYASAGKRIAPAFAFYAGRNAFLERKYGVARDRLALAEKSGPNLAVLGELRFDDLERDITLQHGIPGAENDTHTALAEMLPNLES